MKINSMPAAIAWRQGTWLPHRHLANLILLGLLFLISPGVPRLAAQTTMNTFKWEQPPLPANPTNHFYGWNEFSVYNSGQIAADDFVCTTTNPITKIRWWGSYLGWQFTNPPPILPQLFKMAIWTDVPAGTQGYSHPGQVLWEADAVAYSWKFVGWDYDPRTQQYETCYEFEINLADTQRYYQPRGSNVLWLSIAAQYVGGGVPDYPFGWKTRPRNPESPAPDDAVRIFAPLEPKVGTPFLAGEPIYWPDPASSWDLAFELIYTQTTITQKWLQPPDLTLYGIDINDSVPLSGAPYDLADDFLCVSKGPLTDITIWGSWFNDVLPGNPTNVQFTLVIHRDIPASPPTIPYSRPGTILWTNVFSPGQFKWQIQQAGQYEGWMDPPSAYQPQADRNIHRYDFQIDPSLAFVQQGSAATPVVYWLEVQARPLGTISSAKFGWKTSDDQWNDSAVWVNGYAPYAGIDWKELRYPSGHPYVGTRIGLAFSVSTSGQSSGIKWSQPPARYISVDAFDGWDEMSVYGYQRIVADDWVCTNANPVTDIHWWGSFLGWNSSQGVPLPQGFHLAIWTDVPQGSTAFSHPGQVVWTTYCETYNWEFAGWDIDPRNPNAAPEACFKFDYDLPQARWFYQEPRNGSNIYWLSIAAVYPTGQTPQYPWGWLTRLRDSTSPAPDDAVKIFLPNNPVLNSQYLQGQPLEFPTGVSWDCAFALTTKEPTNCVEVLCPSNITYTCGGTNGAYYYYSNVYAINRCTGELRPAQCYPPSGSFFPLGNTPVCCTNIWDAQTNFCCFSVTVLRDTVPPEITCPADMVLAADLGQCSKSNVTWQVQVGDNCSVASIVCDPPSGSTFSVYPWAGALVTCTATDSSGNTANCSFVVAVRDLEPPFIACPENIVTPADPGQCSKSNVTWTVQASNACAGVIVACSPSNGWTFPVGMTPVTCTARDNWGNTNSCNFTVTVRDLERPSIVCPPSMEVISSNCLPMWVYYPAPVASDNCSGVTTVCSPASGSIFPIGTTPVTCCARDASANSNCCTFSVTVTCPASPTKWLQPPDLTSNGLDVLATVPTMLADDFQCTNRGPITDIHIWGSWRFDQVDPQASFWVSLWSDVRASNGVPSHPGELQWSQWFKPGDYQARLFAQANENFYDPNNHAIIGPDTQVWQYDFFPKSALLQQGTSNNPVVYWVAVAAVTREGTLFGWKTSAQHWNDDAVYGHLQNWVPVRDWRELVDPRSNQSMDLSFSITTYQTNWPPCPDPKVFTQPPDAQNGLDVLASFPTILADDFVCTQPGWITNIIVWGSWASDLANSNVAFLFGIWSDEPALPNGGPSHPKQLLASHWFQPGQYAVGPIQSAVERFYDPNSGQIIAPDNQLWTYTFRPPESTFWQAGTPQAPKVYWLSVIADTTNRLFGWKSSTTHLQDAAVFGHVNAAWTTLGDWRAMRYPQTTLNLDLAFSIATDTRAPAITSIALWNNSVILQWSACPGRLYRVQYKNSLGIPVPLWQDLPGDIMALDTIATRSDLMNNSNRFFRVLSLP